MRNSPFRRIGLHHKGLINIVTAEWDGPSAAEPSCSEVLFVRVSLIFGTNAFDYAALDASTVDQVLEAGAAGQAVFGWIRVSLPPVEITIALPGLKSHARPTWAEVRVLPWSV